MLIDTHCHIHDLETYEFALKRQNAQRARNPLNPEDFTPDKMLTRASEAGVKQVICVGTSHEDSLLAWDFAGQHENVFWAYGVHPDEAGNGDTRDEAHLPFLGYRAASPPSRVSALLSSPVGSKAPRERQVELRLVAIGEIGLDYRNGASSREAQIRLFEEMLQLAKEVNLPCIFHVREAFGDFFAVLENFPEARGVVHSFSDNPENLARALEAGFYIGVNGLITFAKEIPLPPLERTLLETDAPFLTPEPFRGTINEPAHIRAICAYLAKVKGGSEQEIAKITTENARKVFKL